MKTLEELKNEDKKTSIKDRAIHEIRGLAWAFFVVIMFRTILVQFFVVPSGSMYPNVEIGDCLYVTKFTYGYSRASFPFGHHIHSLKGRMLGHDPKRGEVVVFINPMRPEHDYIKRLVGLPGDRVQVINGVLHINSQPAKLERIENYKYHDDRSGRDFMVPQYLETLPGDTTSHRILKMAEFGRGQFDNTVEYTIPADHFFFMGDNRDHSNDSRDEKTLGIVHRDFVIGPAIGLFFSTSAKWYEPLKWVTGVKWERIGKFIN